MKTTVSSSANRTGIPGGRDGARIAVPVAVAALVIAGTGFATAPPRQPGPAASAATTLADTTSVGVHNAYQQDHYDYFADALDSGASLLELDVWTNAFGSGWRVSHDNPTGDSNNCENASSAADLRSKGRDQDLGGCLSDMKAWHDAHPGHRPILIKVEMKDGFNAKGGRGPAELDSLIARHLGNAVLTPADVTGDHADLDDAVTHGGWPARDALKGKFLFDLIPGTVEEQNPADSLWTDEEYAAHLRDLAAGGDLAKAQAFPAVHKAEAGDPRVERYPADLRPWFVVFDGDASAYADGIDTAWYQDHGYLTVMTDAQKVAPAIDATSPTEQQATDKVRQLAGMHASFATSDWYPLPGVLSQVIPRG